MNKKKSTKGYPFVKISDGTIIKEKTWSSRYSKYDPKAVHYYVAKYDKKKEQYSFYPTSHYIDPEKQRDVRKGNAILMRIKGGKGVSTVYKQPRKKDVHGQPFDKNFDNYEKVGALSPLQILRFERFLKNKKKSTHKK